MGRIMGTAAAAAATAAAVTATAAATTAGADSTAAAVAAAAAAVGATTELLLLPQHPGENKTPMEGSSPRPQGHLGPRPSASKEKSSRMLL